MATPHVHYTATGAWTEVLAATVEGDGRIVAPRGLRTLEVEHQTVAFQMRRPVIRAPQRKLSWRFSAGEALWIISGDDTVEGIAPFNARIAEYSDDGVKFFGAYGPKLQSQLEYVIRKLIEDRYTRQAVVNIWRENPPPTRDVPCTLSWTFAIRRNRLNLHAMMRSNDVWLGAPYDFFNFALVGIYVACLVNQLGMTLDHEAPYELPPEQRFVPVEPGVLYHTAASSHLYEPQWVDALRVLEEQRHASSLASTNDALDPAVVRAGRWDLIEGALERARDEKRPPIWPRPTPDGRGWESPDLLGREHR